MSKKSRGSFPPKEQPKGSFPPQEEKVYKITIRGEWKDKLIFVNDFAQPLSLHHSKKTRDYNVHEINWGDHSDATKQTALAILIAVGDTKAEMMFKYFAAQILANLPKEDFVIQHELY